MPFSESHMFAAPRWLVALMAIALVGICSYFFLGSPQLVQEPKATYVINCSEREVIRVSPYGETSYIC